MKEARRAWIVERTVDPDKGELFYVETGADYALTFDQMGVYCDSADNESVTLYPWHTVLAVEVAS